MPTSRNSAQFRAEIVPWRRRDCRQVGQLALGLAVILALPACGSTAYQASVPFTYPELGVGGGPVAGSIVLAQGTEVVTVSLAVVEAVQALGFSIIKPELAPGSNLEPKMEWSTDTVTVPVEDIARYNQLNRSAPLATDRYYGVQYSGSYAIVGKQFRFTMKPALFQRGAVSRFQPYQREYNGQFFVNRLSEQIVTRLKAATRTVR